MKLSRDLKSPRDLEERCVALGAQRRPSHVVSERLGCVDYTVDGLGALALKELTITIVVNKWDFIFFHYIVIEQSTRCADCEAPTIRHSEPRRHSCSTPRN